MLNGRQSFLVSLSFHLGLLIVLLVAGAIMASKLGKREPIEFDLLAPIQVPNENRGAPEPRKEPEPEPEITEHVIEEHTFNPNRSLNLGDIPDIANEEFTPYKPNVAPIDDLGSPSSPEASYIQLIVAVCEQNWNKTKPARGVLGRTVPTLDVAITVARHGRILNHRITRSSGNAALDRSVREAIELSNPFPAFTSDMKGAEQEFKLRFILDD